MLVLLVEAAALAALLAAVAGSTAYAAQTAVTLHSGAIVLAGPNHGWRRCRCNCPAAPRLSASAGSAERRMAHIGPALRSPGSTGPRSTNRRYSRFPAPARSPVLAGAVLGAHDALLVRFPLVAAGPSVSLPPSARPHRSWPRGLIPRDARCSVRGPAETQCAASAPIGGLRPRGLEQPQPASAPAPGQIRGRAPEGLGPRAAGGLLLDLDVAEQQRGAELVDGDVELVPLGAVVGGPGAGHQRAGQHNPVALLQPGAMAGWQRS